MNWRLTATTLFCKQVHGWVPILVYKEGRTHCGFFQRQADRKNNNGRLRPCAGPQNCSLCVAYREDVFRREAQMKKTEEGQYEGKLPA